MASVARQEPRPLPPPQYANSPPFLSRTPKLLWYLVLNRLTGMEGAWITVGDRSTGGQAAGGPRNGTPHVKAVRAPGASRGPGNKRNQSTGAEMRMMRGKLHFSERGPGTPCPIG
jgi:hypothetical protein